MFTGRQERDTQPTVIGTPITAILYLNVISRHSANKPSLQSEVCMVVHILQLTLAALTHNFPCEPAGQAQTRPSFTEPFPSRLSRRPPPTHPPTANSDVSDCMNECECLAGDHLLGQALFSVILLIESKQDLMDSSALSFFLNLAFKGRQESAESTEDANWF